MCEFPLVLAFPLGGCAEFSVNSVELVTDFLIKIVYNTTVTVNDAFLDLNNYSILLEGTSTTDIQKLQVVAPMIAAGSSQAPSTTYTLIRTSQITPGARYTVSVSNLQSTTQVAIGANSNTIQALRTKTNTALNLIPSHFDKRPTSIIFNMLAGICQSDEIIGGSFEYPRTIT